MAVDRRGFLSGACGEAKIIGWRLELNGQDTLSTEEVAEVYLAMTEMQEAINDN
jgi:hypothetical protein